MKLEKIAEAAIGAYLLLPGPEDWGPQGIATIPTSAALGALLLADAFNVKLR